MGFWKTLFDKLFGGNKSRSEMTPLFPDAPARPPYVPLGFIPPRPENPPPYKVYTRLFDKVVTADELGAVLGWGDRPKRALDENARQTVDDLLPGWRVDLESAAAKVLIALRRKARLAIREDTVVCLLIDLSGSMRNEPIQLAAIAVDVAQTLMLKLGCAVEILGFTTSAWRGGRSYKMWQADGRRVEPGRLNDLLHIIFRAADSSGAWSMADMLNPDLLKENIDGEALDWAAGRLRALSHRRKVLVVVSDGAPVDDATLSTNDGWILDRHLREVVAAIEKAGDIQLAAVGINHDVTRYYRRAATFAAADFGLGLMSVLKDVMKTAWAPTQSVDPTPPEAS